MKKIFLSILLLSTTINTVNQNKAEISHKPKAKARAYKRLISSLSVDEDNATHELKHIDHAITNDSNLAQNASSNFDNSGFITNNEHFECSDNLKLSVKGILNKKQIISCNAFKQKVIDEGGSKKEAGSAHDKTRYELLKNIPVASAILKNQRRMRSIRFQEKHKDDEAFKAKKKIYQSTDEYKAKNRVAASRVYHAKKLKRLESVEKNTGQQATCSQKRKLAEISSLNSLEQTSWSNINNSDFITSSDWLSGMVYEALVEDSSNTTTNENSELDSFDGNFEFDEQYFN